MTVKTNKSPIIRPLEALTNVKCSKRVIKNTKYWAKVSLATAVAISILSLISVVLISTLMGLGIITASPIIPVGIALTSLLVIIAIYYLYNYLMLTPITQPILRSFWKKILSKNWVSQNFEDDRFQVNPMYSDLCLNLKRYQNKHTGGGSTYLLLSEIQRLDLISTQLDIKNRSVLKYPPDQVYYKKSENLTQFITQVKAMYLEFLIASSQRKDCPIIQARLFALDELIPLHELELFNLNKSILYKEGVLLAALSAIQDFTALHRSKANNDLVINLCHVDRKQFHYSRKVILTQPSVRYKPLKPQTPQAPPHSSLTSVWKKALKNNWNIVKKAANTSLPSKFKLNKLVIRENHLLLENKITSCNKLHLLLSESSIKNLAILPKNNLHKSVSVIVNAAINADMTRELPGSGTNVILSQTVSLGCWEQLVRSSAPLRPGDHAFVNWEDSVIHTNKSLSPNYFAQILGFQASNFNNDIASVIPLIRKAYLNLFKEAIQKYQCNVIQVPLISVNNFRPLGNDQNVIHHWEEGVKLGFILAINDLAEISSNFKDHVIISLVNIKL